MTGILGIQPNLPGFHFLSPQIATHIWGHKVSGSRLFVAVYSTHVEGELAIRKMQSLGLDMNRLSFVGRDYRTEDKALGRYQSNDRTRYWENLGALGNGVWNLLSGVAFFYVPEMGPFLVGGPLASSTIGTLEGSTPVSGLSAIGSGLNIIGIPKDKVHKYERALKSGNHLVIAQGSEEEMAEVKAIVKRTDVLEFDLYGG